MIAPHRNGFPVHPKELDLPKTELNPVRAENYNNHHRIWPARIAGRLMLTQTLRDLKDSQVVMPKDVHAIYHDRYDPPPLPSIEDTMQRLDDAYHKGELLRYGTANRPTYKPISDILWQKLNDEYGRVR